MDGAVAILTCDKYSPFWEGMYYYMDKYWDYSIPWPIYFCNETLAVPHHPHIKHLPLGPGPYHERQLRMVSQLQNYKYIFYLQEEFWPYDRMTREMFMGLFQLIEQNNWDCLHLYGHQPEHYILEPTDVFFKNRRIMRFSNKSNWFFSQQARFWKRELLQKCIVPPLVSEEKISSSISVEVECDKYMRQNFPDSKVMLYHYWWYPIAGVAWRGKMSAVGQEMQYKMMVDKSMK